jgi:hypothetical protein
MRGPSRRSVVRYLAGVVGVMYGRVVSTGSQGRAIQLVLDDVVAVQVIYRGQRVHITPQEIVTALSGRED